MPNVSKKVNVRLDVATRRALAAFAETHALTVSQAVRMLVAQALEADLRDPQRSWRTAAFREGIAHGLATFNKRLQGAIVAALEDGG